MSDKQSEKKVLLPHEATLRVQTINEVSTNYIIGAKIEASKQLSKAQAH